MGKMSELNLVLNELKECSKTLTSISESLTEIFSSTSDDSEVEVIPKVAQEPEISFLDVRKIFVEKSRAGHTDALKKLLESYGADKLSSIEPSEYQSLLADVEAIQ